MIQRIQTLYLLLTFIGMLLLCFFPIATFIGGNEEFEISIWGIHSTDIPDVPVVKTVQMGILWVLSTLLPLVNIFLFKRRWLQLRLCLVEIVLLLGMQIYIAFYIFNSRSVIADFAVSSMKYSPVNVIPIIGIILSILAFRGIVHDQALIKSLNRIR